MWRARGHRACSWGAWPRDPGLPLAGCHLERVISPLCALVCCWRSADNDPQYFIGGRNKRFARSA